jgi:hypothetical protein
MSILFINFRGSGKGKPPVKSKQLWKPWEVIPQAQSKTTGIIHEREL